LPCETAASYHRGILTRPAGSALGPAENIDRGWIDPTMKIP
jgi:hypothetical protein